MAWRDSFFSNTRALGLFSSSQENHRNAFVHIMHKSKSKLFSSWWNLKTRFLNLEGLWQDHIMQSQPFHLQLLLLGQKTWPETIHAERIAKLIQFLDDHSCPSVQFTLLLHYKLTSAHIDYIHIITHIWIIIQASVTQCCTLHASFHHMTLFFQTWFVSQELFQECSDYKWLFTGTTGILWYFYCRPIFILWPIFIIYCIFTLYCFVKNIIRIFSYFFTPWSFQGTKEHFKEICLSHKNLFSNPGTSLAYLHQNIIFTCEPTMCLGTSK